MECLLEKVFIWIRTEACWYKLDEAGVMYQPWFKVLIKCASIAIKIITVLLKEVKSLKNESPCFIEKSVLLKF